jgi:Tol biopolymer transport system component
MAFHRTVPSGLLSWRGLSLAPLLCLPLAAQGGRLSATLVPGGDVVEFQLAPDGTRLVYRADQDVDGVFELYGVSLDGGTPVRLNGALVAGGSVGRDFEHAFRISPDGSRVVYMADEEQDDVLELFSAPLDGSGPAVKLSGTLVAGGNVLAVPSFAPAVAFAPMTSGAGARVLYVADQEVDEVFELYSAPLDGSQPAVKLSGPLVADGDVVLVSPPFTDGPLWPQPSPDGSRAVYRADQERDEVIELYSVPIDGSEPATRLNPSLGLGGDVYSALFRPDSRTVLYVANRGGVGPTELFRVPLEGTPARVRRTDDRDAISLPLAPFHHVDGVSIAPDGARAVYRANPAGGVNSQLYSVPIDGAHPSSELSHLADGRIAQTGIGADGARVVYAAGGEESFNDQVYSVPIDGSEDRVRISALGYAGGFELSPDARRAVYILRSGLSGPAQLHSAPLDGSEPSTRLEPVGTTPGPFRISPDSRYVLYLRSATPVGPRELYAASIDGSLPDRRLSAPLVPGGSVGDSAGGFAVTAAGRVVYLADQETDEVVELFVTSLVPPHRRAP